MLVNKEGRSIFERPSLFLYSILFVTQLLHYHLPLQTLVVHS
jgi:hypothetical protein